MISQDSNTQLVFKNGPRPPQTPLAEDGSNNVEWDFPPPYADRPQAVDNGDLGNRATWLLIALMFIMGLSIALTAYLLPHGQDSLYPPIRVY